MNKSALLIAMLLLTVFIAGCGGAELIQTPTPEPTAEPTPILPNMIGFVIGKPGAVDVIYGSGNGDMRSDVFILDNDCNLARAEWEYVPKTLSASIQFSINDGDYTHISHWTGASNPPHVDYEEFFFHSGWYYVIVDGVDVDWEFRLKCLEY